MTDPISDMLTQIRNGLAVKKTEVVLPYSKVKENLARVLANQGYLENVETLDEEGKKSLKLGLKYLPEGEPALSGVRRISKPGQRIYAKVTEIPPVKLGFGATILSTSKGIMTDKQARKEKMGGELICQVW